VVTQVMNMMPAMNDDDDYVWVKCDFLACCEAFLGYRALKVYHYHYDQ
jgi:hypothetical protein